MTDAGSARLDRPYRFGFILTTLLGNETRYRNLRKYAERAANVECIWAPVRHYYTPDEHDPVRFLPGPLHTRGVVVAQAWPVLNGINRFDAVMVHQLEILSLLAARSHIRKGPVIVAAQDMPPIIDPANYPPYPEVKRPAWRRKIRLTNDIWAARRAGHFIGFSKWSTDIMLQCGLDAGHVLPLHVGLDLEQWTKPPPRARSPRTQILVVASDFDRKGGPALLEMFQERYSDRCDLQIVTRQQLGDLPPNVYVHYGLGPGSPKLVQLFHDADVFVLPTLADVSSWVSLEAMASECAVAVSDVGGIKDLLTPDTGILFDPNNRETIVAALDRLVGDPDLCRSMGKAGRARVEAEFDSAKNVPAMLDQMKRWSDARR